MTTIVGNRGQLWTSTLSPHLESPHLDFPEIFNLWALREDSSFGYFLTFSGIFRNLRWAKSRDPNRESLAI